MATVGSRKESQVLGRGPSTSVLEMLEKLGELLTSYDTLSFKVSVMEVCIILHICGTCNP